MPRRRRYRRWSAEEKRSICQETLGVAHTDVLERMVSGQTKAHELERPLPLARKAERLAAAVDA
jgi:hypothetical protein